MMKARIFIALAPVLALSCAKEVHDETGCREDIEITFSCGEPVSKSSDPDENLVTDMNIFIFDDRGILDTRTYLTSGQMQGSGSGYSMKANLLHNGTYSIYAIANAGFALNLGTLEELSEYRYYFTYPDEYRTGIPMSGTAENVTASKGKPLKVPLLRTMSKISLCIDRSRLDSDVDFHVKSVKIGGCPKFIYPFRQSAVSGSFDTFVSGFSKSGTQVEPLNTDTGWGKSGSVSVYMFENMQGELLPDTGSDSDKVFEEGNPMAELCSYIEMRVSYASDSHFTASGDDLIYRFYLGEGRGNFDVERNTHYHITVTPENDGLTENSWRVDQSGISSYISDIQLSFSSMRMSYRGEQVQLSAYISPENASCDDISWKSSDSAIASVDEKGRVQANGEGKCTVTCMANDGSGKYAECQVDCSFKPTYLKVYPGNFIRGKVGETYHIRCEYFPSSAPFDIGIEELEYDRERGIYDYTVDENGNGVVLTFRKRGSGLLYFEAGYPVNQAELISVLVD